MVQHGQTPIDWTVADFEKGWTNISGFMTLALAYNLSASFDYQVSILHGSDSQ